MVRSTVTLLFLTACSGPGPIRAPGRVQLPVRLAEARHADLVELDIFVWPKGAPPAEVSDASCMWWSGDRRGRDVALAGLSDGTLGWASLVVTRDGIDWAGQRVVSLDGAGRIPVDQVADGALPALSASLRASRAVQDAWFEACGRVYRDRPLLVVEQAVPSSTVLAVLRTLSVNRFPRVAALVGDRQADNRGLEAPEDPGVLVVVRPDGESVQVMDSLGMRRLSGPTAELEGMVASAAAGRRFGCALVVPERASRWSDVVATVDTTTAFGAASALVHSEDAWSPGPEASTEAARAPTEWLTLDGTAAVHWLDTPSLEVSWSDLSTPIACDAVGGEVRLRVPVPGTLQLALSTPGDDANQPCVGPNCVPLMQPLEDDTDIEPVTIGWQAYGPLALPDPDAAEGPLVPTAQALKACPPPRAAPGQSLGRAVGWVEIDPQGKAFDAQFGVMDGAHRPWATCLRNALRTLPTLSGSGGKGQHSVVQVWVDAQLKPVPTDVDSTPE